MTVHELNMRTLAIIAMASDSQSMKVVVEQIGFMLSGMGITPREFILAKWTTMLERFVDSRQLGADFAEFCTEMSFDFDLENKKEKGQ